LWGVNVGYGRREIAPAVAEQADRMVCYASFGAQPSGPAAEVVAQLKGNEQLGVDAFVYYASMGLDRRRQKRSLELFCSEVMPAFA